VTVKIGGNGTDFSKLEEERGGGVTKRIQAREARVVCSERPRHLEDVVVQGGSQGG